VPPRWRPSTPAESGLPETRGTASDVDSCRAEREGGGEPTPVGDAARGHDRNRHDGIDDLRHEGQRGHRTAVPTGLATLGDDDVDAARRRLAGLGHRRDLVHHETPGVVRTLHQLARVVERERDHRGGRVQREREAGVVDVGNDMIDSERPVGGIADGGEVGFELDGRPLPRANASKATRVRDCDDELG
jgi:hypothetical protein